MTGKVVEISPLRLTPAGVPVASFRLAHQSSQVENELPRDVTCEIEALALGQVARVVMAAGLGVEVKLQGFLAQKSLRNTRPVLHVELIELIELIEGTQNGIQTESRPETQR